MTRSNRRYFLRASGALVALPALNSLRENSSARRACATESNHASAETDSSVNRFCCVYFPNGVSLPPSGHPDHAKLHWFPHQTGSDYKFNEPLSPLEPYRSQLTILGGLSHPSTREMVGHAAGDTFLTGADQSQRYTNSVSVDQLYAANIIGRTRFPSLSLSSDGGVGSPGRAKTMSFTPSGKPIPGLSSPRLVFNRLFGVDNRSIEQQRRDFGIERSVLDSVSAEAKQLKAGLSASDRARLDEYLSSVREIELRLSRADVWLGKQKPHVGEEQFDLQLTATDGPEDYMRVIFDLMHAAIMTDSTRSLTYQVTSEDAKGIGDRFPQALGLKGHHDLSHSAADEDGYANWARYDQFLADQFAYFLERLQSTDDPENEGTLLDNTMVLYGCGTSETHLAKNYPLILAGASAMGLRHGQYRVFDEQKFRMSDLFVTMLNRLGVETDRFADSTTDLDVLTRT